MADGIQVTFEGLEQVSARMIELAGPAMDRIARRAVLAGGRVVQAAITAKAPVRPDLPSGTALPVGALANDIEVKTRKEPDGSISAYIAPGSLTRHAARLVEYGHRQIAGGKSTQDGGILGQSYRGKGKVIAKEVPPHPFIRGAFESSEPEAQDAIAMSIATDFSRGFEVVMPDYAPALGSGE